MASSLDLDEQEQLDQFKHFWQQYGHLITWVLIGVLTAFAGYNGWQYWQRQQAARAASLFDEYESALRSGDMTRIDRVFGDLKTNFSSSAYTTQAGMLTAKAQFDKGQGDQAQRSLEWVVAHASSPELQALARLRLAALQMDGKQWEPALKTLDMDWPADFAGLVADRRADIYWAQNKPDQAKAEWQKALQGLPVNVEYRRMVQAKLNSLGVGTP
jgi:predicted negative regulator of RcsB-dependent stress response